MGRGFGFSVFLLVSSIGMVAPAHADSLNFAITPSQPGANPGPYRPTQPANCIYGPAAGHTCRTDLLPLSVIDLGAGGTIGFFADMDHYPLWEIEFGGNLEGAFNIKQYAAINDGDVAGANFELDYVAVGDDPTTDLHWIQRVVDNHAIDGVHGDPEDVIDYLAPLPGQSRDDVPYYDVLPTGPGAKTPWSIPPHFDDGPRREAENSHVWYAEVFLVQEIGAEKIKVYNGVGWGWTNSVPEPSSMAGLSFMLSIVLAAVLLGRHAPVKTRR